MVAISEFMNIAPSLPPFLDILHSCQPNPELIFHCVRLVSSVADPPQLSAGKPPSQCNANTVEPSLSSGESTVVVAHILLLLCFLCAYLLVCPVFFAPFYLSCYPLLVSLVTNYHLSPVTFFLLSLLFSLCI